MEALENDYYNSSGQCNLALAKEGLYNPTLAWGVAKNSPYMESLNRGFK